MKSLVDQQSKEGKEVAENIVSMMRHYDRMFGEDDTSQPTSRAGAGHSAAVAHCSETTRKRRKRKRWCADTYYKTRSVRFAHIVCNVDFIVIIQTFLDPY